MILLLLLPAVVSSQDSQYGQYQNGQFVQSTQYTMSGSTSASQPQYNPSNQQQNLYGSSNGQSTPNQNQFGTNQQFQTSQYSTSPPLQYNQPAQQIPMGQNSQYDQYGRPMNQQGSNAQFDQSQQSNGPSEPIYDADGNVINGYAHPAQNNQNGQFQSSSQSPNENQYSNQFNQNQTPNQFNQNQTPNQFNQNQQYQNTQNQNGQEWTQNPNGVSNRNSAQLTQYSFNNGQCVYQNGQVFENGVSRPLNQTEQQQLVQFEQSLTQYGRALSASMGSFVQALLSWNPQSQSFPSLSSSSPQIPSLPCFCSQSSCQAGQVNSQYSQQFIGPLQTNSPQFDENNNQYQTQPIQNQQANQYQTNQYQPPNNQFQNSQFQNSNNQYQNQPNQNSQFQSNQYGRR
ncbi:hypothetical protein PMAYCL1PPCAC_29340 [Pristionchus mayeri]|uniref:CB1 cannabinoid receptor-interacting protein 1 n=1 Tax=Pristionchus mayeri TaxID=1317129 RepID=A0AAN5ICI6_9BILA|nr:hypothetical protein PMAYCL1PPCAC_29340 [Pristionchus mayeri]